MDSTSRKKLSRIIVANFQTMAEDAVQKYLETTNRPYSANDIVLNMHKQWGKTGVQRALDNLVAANIVLEKTYGKQKVYVIKQDPNDCPTEEELKGFAIYFHSKLIFCKIHLWIHESLFSELDRNIAQSTQELREVEDTVKKLEGELKSLTGAMTMTQAKKEIAIVQKDIEDLEVRLDSLSKNSVPISPEKMKKVKDDNEKVNKEYRWVWLRSFFIANHAFYYLNDALTRVVVYF